MLAQLTGDPSAMANLSQALFPTLLPSLEDALALQEDGPVSPSNPRPQGERGRQSISRGSTMMSPQHMQGLVSNYPLGNPAQHNQTMQPCAVRGMQPLPLSWVIITRAMQPQCMVTQAIQPTGL